MQPPVCLPHTGVALCPKELRASFVEFLKTNKHGDETLRAAAKAMKHSSKTQASHSYSRGESDRLAAAAVRVAEAYAANFNHKSANACD